MSTDRDKFIEYKSALTEKRIRIKTLNEIINARCIDISVLQAKCVRSNRYAAGLLFSCGFLIAALINKT